MTGNRPEDPPPSEATLRAAARGEAEAVDRWYRAELPPVYRLCFGVLADAAEAEDLAQDAMLHLLDRLARSYDPARPWRAWRDAVVLNLARDRLRRIEARSRAEAASAELAAGTALPDPADAARASEVQSLLERALAALSPREREAFVLRDLEGRSTAEVAEGMGVEPASVRSLVTLARRRLRRLLGSRLPTVGVEGESRG